MVQAFHVRNIQNFYFCRSKMNKLKVGKNVDSHIPVNFTVPLPLSSQLSRVLLHHFMMLKQM